MAVAESVGEGSKGSLHNMSDYLLPYEGPTKPCSFCLSMGFTSPMGIWHPSLWLRFVSLGQCPAQLWTCMSCGKEEAEPPA